MSKFGYDLFAETKEYLAVNGEIVKSWIQIMVQKGMEGFDCFLDVATGIGTMVRLFLENLPEGCKEPAVIALDFDTGALEEVKSRFATRVPKLELLHSCAKQIDLPDRSVDVAVWGNGIHYVDPEEQEQSLQEIRRVLKSGGWLFFNTAFHAESRPAETLPFYRAHVREAVKILHERNVKREKGHPRPQASNFLPKSYYEELIEKTGFRLQEIKEFVARLHQTAWEHISSFPQYAAGALHGLPLEEAVKALREAVATALAEHGEKDEQGKPYVPRKWLAVSAQAP